MGAKDNAQKDFFDDNKRFADLYNGIMFQGKPIIKAVELEEADPNIVYWAEKKHAEIIPDKVKKWRGTHLAILTLENQSEVDYSMVFRAMKTEVLNYDKQLRRKKAKNRRKKQYGNAAEYLSGIRKEEKFIPVIVVVLYLGIDKRWDGATSLYEMLDMDNRLQPYITNYKLNLYDYHDYDDYSIFKTENRELFEMLSCAGNEEKMNALIHRNEDRYSKLDADATQVINSTVGIEIKTERKKEENGQEAVDMCKAWDDHWNSGKIEGHKEGHKEGQTELLLSIINKKIRKNLSLERIAEDLEEEVETIRPLYEKIKGQAQMV